MNEATIVDSHVHLWDPTRFRYSWLESLPALNRPFLPGDFAAAEGTSSVAKFIFVEGGCEASQGLAEVDWVSVLAKSEPRLKAIIAHANLEKGDAARAELEALRQRPLVKGVRRNLQGESDPLFCLRSEFVEGVRMLAKFGFKFDLCIKHHQLHVVAELVKRVPEVVFVLDHCAKPEVRSGIVEPWATSLRVLAALPNVVCKLSGLTTEADWTKWQPMDLESYFKVVIDCFGFERVLFGGDWPVATLATSYQRWVGTVSDAMSFASAADCRKLLQTNAERVYDV